ncbi:protein STRICTOSIDINE SYNTHASE-LIKE 10-like [Telopea speciosissima]|uniref:protein STRICTOSIDINE SYNTHASE-LIKE 10-like n=1 Tax=Telopea speciosissima TaxID=54955 RepID=UPI001CC73332|nr:protein STRICTOSIDINE SYNTHASE-LIKE 10-like [Telopea speciosissima]
MDVVIRIWFLVLFTIFTVMFIGSLSALSIPIEIASSPESLAFDCEGHGPYAGVSDGRVLRWEGVEHGWTQFSISSISQFSSFRLSNLCDGSNDPRLEPYCGRPLGLEFNNITCELYIADSTFGLLTVGPIGGFATQFAAGVNGVPFLFANRLDIDQNTGIIYSEYVAIILSGDLTGRLLKYDPSTSIVTVLLGGLAFPNGADVSHDSTFVLVTETTTGRILRYWLKGPKATTKDVFIQLPGQPDNIKRNARGEFWVTVNSFQGGPRFMPLPQIPSITHSQAMKLNENGMVMEVFVGNDRSRLEATSEAQENDENLWIGSIVSFYVSVFRI